MEEIKAGDIMTGNYLFASDNQIHKVSKFDEHTVWFEKTVNKYGVSCWVTSKITECRPILLTEDILLKCGFELVQDGDFSKRYDLIKDERFDFLINNGNEQLSGIRFKGNTLYDEIKYLHQLQNLFFILSGNQLIINI